MNPTRLLVLLAAVVDLATNVHGDGHHTGFASFSATLSPIAGSDTAKGTVTVVVKGNALFLTGKGENLAAGLVDGAGGCDPSGTNSSCGVHIHSGTGCADSTAQGGHFFQSATDPWALVGYSTTSATGTATFDAALVGTVDTTKIPNKPVVVHDKTGARVACGVLKRNADHVHGTYGGELSAYGAGSKVSGHVAIAVVDDRLFLTGDAKDLEKSLVDGAGGCDPSGTNNSCGVHIHSGTGCADSTAQGGHFFQSATDPWALVGYSTTSATGAASFHGILKGTVDTAKIGNKPFVVHNKGGGRVACGMIEKDPHKDGHRHANGAFARKWTSPAAVLGATAALLALV
jgi:predicted DNA-binding protein with PD1-like motif